jgi:hypothetical protein
VHLLVLIKDNEDDLLVNDIIGDGHVRSECETDEGTDCEDADSDTDW